MVATKVVIYGLSTEGYDIASHMAKKGADVYIVDESASSAFSLKAEIAQKYKVSSINEDDLFLDMIPIDVAVSSAQYVFFAPRIRKSDDDVQTEINSKFKDAVSALKKNSSVVFGVPTFFGGSTEIISLIEHVTGFEVGKQVSYYYYPLDINQQPKVIGSFNGKPDPKLGELLSTEDQQKRFVTISSSEYFHGMNILSRSLHMSSILEITKRAYEDSPGEVFLYDNLNNLFFDEMLNGLFDLKILLSSFEGANTVTVLINSSIKAIDHYIKLLTDQIRNTLKDHELKASRTKLVLSWHIDQYSMRNDKILMMDSIITKFRDYVADVESYKDTNYNLFNRDKRMLVIPCSSSDCEYVEKMQEDTDIIILKTNPFCEVIS